MKRHNLAMTTMASFALGVSLPSAAQIATENVVFSAKAVAAGLKGLGNVPGLAGWSPSYIVRQLYDLQSGARAGAAAQKKRPIAQI
jgi:cytochrome c553